MVGILALEVIGLVLKVVNLWQSLSDREILSLREGIVNSVGVKMVVLDNDDYLMELGMMRHFITFNLLHAWWLGWVRNAWIQIIIVLNILFITQLKIISIGPGGSIGGKRWRGK